MTTKSCTYRLDSDQDEKMEIISKKLGITKSEFLRNAINAYIYEDKYHELLKHYKQAKAKELKYYDELEQMIKIMQEIEKERKDGK